MAKLKAGWIIVRGKDPWLIGSGRHSLQSVSFVHTRITSVFGRVVHSVARLTCYTHLLSRYRAHKDQIEASRCVYTNCTENLNHEFSLPFPHTLVLNPHCDRMMFELSCDKILFNSGSLVRSRIDRSAMVSSSIVDIAIAEHGSVWQTRDILVSSGKYKFQMVVELNVDVIQYQLKVV